MANGGAGWSLYFHLEWEADRVTAEPRHPDPSSYRYSSITCPPSQDLPSLSLDHLSSPSLDLQCHLFTPTLHVGAALLHH